LLVHNGVVYSFYPPYFPLLVVPFYDVLGSWGLYVLPLAGLAACLVLFILLGRVLGCRAPGTIALAMGVFGTPIFFYGVVFWEHTLAAALSGAGLFMLFLAKDRRNQLLLGLVAGALVGLSTILREEGYVLAAAIFVAFLISHRRHAVSFVAGWLPVMTALWLFQWHVFGNPLGIHAMVYENHVSKGPLIFLMTKAGDLWHYLFRYCENPMLAGIIGIPLVLVVVVGLVPRRPRPTLTLIVLGVAVSAVMLGTTSLVVEKHPLLATRFTQGLFPGAPILILFALAGRLLASHPRGIVRTATLVGGAGILGTALLLNRRDIGIIWGPRHFLSILPVVLALSWLGYHELQGTMRGQCQRKILAGFATILLLCGLVQQVHALRLLALKKNVSARLLDAVRRDPTATIVTDVFWVPEELAPVFFDRKIFRVYSAEDYLILLSRLAAAETPSVLLITGNAQSTLPPAFQDRIRTGHSELLAFRPQQLPAMNLDLYTINPAPLSAHRGHDSSSIVSVASSGGRVDPEGLGGDGGRAAGGMSAWDGRCRGGAGFPSNWHTTAVAPSPSGPGP